MPAFAQASSASPVGAPDTPIAPTVAPPAWMLTPPPTATTFGRCRMPALPLVPSVAFANSSVSVRKLIAVQPLLIAV